MCVTNARTETGDWGRHFCKGYSRKKVIDCKTSGRAQRSSGKVARATEISWSKSANFWAEASCKWDSCCRASTWQEGSRSQSCTLSRECEYMDLAKVKDEGADLSLCTIWGESRRLMWAASRSLAIGSSTLNSQKRRETSQASLQLEIWSKKRRRKSMRGQQTANWVKRNQRKRTWTHRTIWVFWKEINLLIAGVLNKSRAVHLALLMRKVKRVRAVFW